MTQAVSHGYEDWQRTVAATDKLLLTREDADIDTQELVLAAFVGDYSHVGFHFEAIAQHFRVTFEFVSDPTTGVGMGIHEYVIRAGGLCNIHMPILGPYLTMYVAPSAANGSYATRVWTASRGGASVFQDNNYGIPLSLTAESVNAGITENHEGTATMPGLASWYAETSAAANAISIQSIDEAGTVRTIDRSNNLTVVPARLIFLPPTTIRASIFNGDGAARTFTVHVFARPVEPGR